MGYRKPTSTHLTFSIFTPLFSHKLDALRSCHVPIPTFKICPIKTFQVATILALTSCPMEGCHIIIFNRILFSQRETHRLPTILDGDAPITAANLRHTILHVASHHGITMLVGKEMNNHYKSWKEITKQLSRCHRRTSTTTDLQLHHERTSTDLKMRTCMESTTATQVPSL